MKQKIETLLKWLLLINVAIAAFVYIRVRATENERVMYSLGCTDAAYKLYLQGKPTSSYETLKFCAARTKMMNENYGAFD